ncbi:MAG: hypothetical protein RLZZ546_1182 [Bacteroidota bacterium]|jgi:DNA-binding NarL/FixJ family response regulator
MTDVSRVIQIIIVDDHPIIIDGIKSLLAKEKEINLVASFQDAPSALNFISNYESEIDVVLTDISMEGMTGIELCKNVKNLNRDIKVLVLSMYNSKEIVREAISAEADGYILKSEAGNDLIRAIKRVYCHGTYFSEEIIPIITYQGNRKNLVENNLKSQLSERELEILKLIVNDNTSEEIAKELFISVKTVGHHRQHILAKTGCKSSVGLVKYALELGLI